MGGFKNGGWFDLGQAERYPLATPIDSANIMLAVQNNKLLTFTKVG
jgi:hypothetical protein